MFFRVSEVLDSLGVPLWLFGLFVVLLSIYLYGTWPYSTFSSLGFPQCKTYPFIGSLTGLFAKGLHGDDLDNRRIFKGKAYGAYMGRVPMLVLGDVADIKRLCIKDFTVAPNHWDIRLRGSLKYSLFDSRDARWQNQRQTLSAAFSGLKLKQMTPWIQDCADKMTENIFTAIERDGHFEMKETSGALTLDVLAATGFGIKSDALNNPDTDFVKYAKKFLVQSLKDPALIVIIFMRFLIPLLEKLNYCMVPKDVTDYFQKVIQHSLKHRKDNSNVSVNSKTDFLQLMINKMENIKEENAHVDPTGKWYEKGMVIEEVYANSLMFLIGAYETTANTIAFLAYNLITHPEIQERVIQEIDSVLQGERPDYENVQQLKFLDQCVYETVRIYPPIVRTDRQLIKEFEVEGKVVPPGTAIAIPIYAIHHDDSLWPEAEKFDPDRFADGTKEFEDGRFLGFGIGPRMCIANRLALLEVKMTITRILQSMRLQKCDKTEIPLKLSKDGMLNPANGVYMTGTRRD